MCVRRPEVYFSVRVLRAVQIMEIPLLKNWIHSVVLGGLTEALVDPGKMDVSFERTGPTNMPDTGKAKTLGTSPAAAAPPAVCRVFVSILSYSVCNIHSYSSCFIARAQVCASWTLYFHTYAKHA